MLIRDNRTHRISTAIVIALIVALALLAGCGGTKTQNKTGSDPKAAYLKACEDAKTVEPDEVSKDLKAVVSWEKGLEWQQTPGVSRVRVATWTSKDFYDPSVGKEYKLPADANAWVTLAPDVKDFVKKKGGATPLRIEQLLGLPPNGGKTKFVELWVSPSDLFRPSPDPETTDHEADVDFPTVTGRFLSFTATPITEWDSAAKADKAYTYEQWFNQRKDTVYSGENPYPWTRLGYTYDWGNPKSDVGLSEFVVLGGSTIGVSSVTPTADYLKVK